MNNTNLVKVYVDTNSEDLSIFDNYKEVESLILFENITVETNYVNGFGNFKWKIPKNLFHKTPLRILNRDDKGLNEMEYINEYFEIEFVCEEVKNEESNIETNLKLLQDFGFNFFTYIKINSISFHINKDSELTYSQQKCILFRLQHLLFLLALHHLQCLHQF